MNVMMIRYEVTSDGVEPVREAIRAAFRALEAARPDGVAYAYGQRIGSCEFVAVLALDAGVDNPLPGIPEARQLQAEVAKWIDDAPPVPTPVELIGSYGFAPLRG